MKLRSGLVSKPSGRRLYGGPIRDHSPARLSLSETELLRSTCLIVIAASEKLRGETVIMNITSSFLSRFFFLFPIVCLLLISVPPLPCALLHAEDLVPLDEALPVLESFERRIIRVQWDAEMSSHTCPDLTDRENATLVPLGKGDQGDKCFYRWSVVFEPASGRYRLNQQTANNWVAGAAPYSSSFDEYSYDGKTEREFHWSAHGLELPTTDRKDSAKTGMVDKEQKRRMMERWGISTSIGEFPPYCRTELLSEFLRSQSQARKSVRITKNGSSVWHIQTSGPAAAGQKI